MAVLETPHSASCNNLINIMPQTINNSQHGNLLGDQKIAVTIESITPYMAEKYLETQERNRNTNPLRISEYADRMVWH